MKATRFILFLIFPIMAVTAQTSKSEVMIISTIHGAHKVNPKYSYEALFAFIDQYQPDVIGVELREEDRDSSVSYLKKNYPYEMYECLTRYASKKVVDFDWLGDDLTDKALPENYWKENSIIKKLQQKLAEDSLISKRLSVTNVIQEEKKQLALNSSLTELNDGRYDLINHIYYAQLQLLLKWKHQSF